MHTYIHTPVSGKLVFLTVTLLPPAALVITWSFRAFLYTL